jgi:hypothetical protein
MITITTYKELTDFVAAFGDDNLNMLAICSKGGLGKSEEVRRTLEGREIVSIGGHVTPLKLYEMLHEGRHKKIVFDEIDGLLADTKHVGLLKQLCETREEKKIMWASTDSRAVEIDGGHGYFHTRSHVLMLCNSFQALSANVAALQTRAMLVRFVPTTAEILSKIRTFATDAEIITFLEQFRDVLPEFTLRTYRLLEDLKGAGLDWRKYALDEADVPPKVIEIADLLVQFDTDLERIPHYTASRRDYYNWKPQAEAYLRRRNLGGLADVA